MATLAIRIQIAFESFDDIERAVEPGLSRGYRGRMRADAAAAEEQDDVVGSVLPAQVGQEMRIELAVGSGFLFDQR